MILFDMDKQVLLNSVQRYNTNEAFAMLKSLNGRSFFPKQMFYKNAVSFVGSVKANLFNNFFGQFFNRKLKYD